MKDKIMEDIEVLKEEIKILKENNPSGFQDVKKKIKVALTDVSTDDEGHHSPKNEFLQNVEEKVLPVIDKEALKGDEWGNCDLSNAIEDGNIKKVREIYKTTEDLNDADLLRSIAIDVTHSEVREFFKMSRDTALTIYSEAKYQLNLMGEDTSEVVESYNFE
jgi:hypothetical protein